MKTPDLETVHRVINNIANPDEVRHVLQWFATPEGEEFLTRQMETDYNQLTVGAEEKSVYHQIPSAEMYAYIQKQIQRRKIKQIIFRAAVIIIPLFLFFSSYLELNSHIDLFSKEEFSEIYVPAGEQMQVVFQDGSRVFLNADSKLRYPKKFTLSERRVELEGEGFFEIATNKKRPFIVDLKALNVKVLGTSFDVKSYPAERNIYVSLEEGTIEIKGDKLNSFKLNPGEKVSYDRRTGICKIIRPKDITASSAWKTKRLIFSDTPLSEVFATLSRTFNVTFDIRDQLIVEFNCTLSTDMASIDFVLKELERIMPIQFETEGGNIVVTKK